MGIIAKFINKINPWFFVVAYVTFLYSTLYLARPVCNYLKRYPAFNSIINFVVIISAIVLIVIFLKRLNRLKLYSFFLLGIGFGLSIFFLSLAQYPEEKIHILDYGFLGFLIYRAFLIRFKGPILYILSLLLAACFGYLEEVIQYLLPNRYYSNWDVLLNFLGSFLGLYFVWALRNCEKAK